METDLEKTETNRSTISIGLMQTKQKPSDCEVFQVILHGLGYQQCHTMNPTVECSADGFPTCGVWLNAPHTNLVVFMQSF